MQLFSHQIWFPYICHLYEWSKYARRVPPLIVQLCTVGGGIVGGGCTCCPCNVILARPHWVHDCWCLVNVGWVTWKSLWRPEAEAVPNRFRPMPRVSSLVDHLPRVSYVCLVGQPLKGRLWVWWVEPGFPCKCMFLYIFWLQSQTLKIFVLWSNNSKYWYFSGHVCIFWPFGE